MRALDPVEVVRELNVFGATEAVRDFLDRLGECKRLAIAPRKPVLKVRVIAGSVLRTSYFKFVRYGGLVDGC